MPCSCFSKGTKIKLLCHVNKFPLDCSCWFASPEADMCTLLFPPKTYIYI